jgi:hypothetical protein
MRLDHSESSGSVACIRDEEPGYELNRASFSGRQWLGCPTKDSGFDFGQSQSSMLGALPPASNPRGLNSRAVTAGDTSRLQGEAWRSARPACPRAAARSRSTLGRPGLSARPRAPHDAGDRIIHSERDIGLSAASVQIWFHRYYRALGFKGASSHSGRRTFVTKVAKKIVEAGGSLKDVQELPAMRA